MQRKLYNFCMNRALLYSELLDRVSQTSTTHKARSSLKNWKFPDKQKTIYFLCSFFIYLIMNFVQNSVGFCWIAN